MRPLIRRVPEAPGSPPVAAAFFQSGTVYCKTLLSNFQNHKFAVGFFVFQKQIARAKRATRGCERLACMGWAGPCWIRRPFVQNAIGSFATRPPLLATLLWRWSTKQTSCQLWLVVSRHYVLHHGTSTPKCGRTYSAYVPMVMSLAWATNIAQIYYPKVLK